MAYAPLVAAIPVERREGLERSVFLLARLQLLKGEIAALLFRTQHPFLAGSL